MPPSAIRSSLPTSRTRDAQTYLRVVRPFVLAITAALSVATYYLQPGKITDTDLAVVLIGFVAMVATWLLSYRTDPIRLALAAQPFDALLIVVCLLYTSPSPRD